MAAVDIPVPDIVTISSSMDWRIQIRAYFAFLTICTKKQYMIKICVFDPTTFKLSII